MGLFSSIVEAARERGHRNVLGYAGFCCFYLFNYALTVLATFAPYGMTNVLHRLRGVRIGKDVFIDRTSHLDEVYPHLITLEDGSALAPRAMIVTHSKPVKYLEPYLGPAGAKKVRVCKGAWVAANAVVLPGVTVGEGAIVSAGTVVSKDVPAHTIVAGNPAKVVVTLKKR